MNFFSTTWRLVVMLAMMLAWILHYLLVQPRSLRERSRVRALWCRRIMRAFGISLNVQGKPPISGVVVGNHLSYLDILAYGAVVEGVFVAKLDIRSWPLIGLITQLAGTIYVDRNRKRSLLGVIHQVRQALDEDLPVVFFPEGTTSRGSTVLPFFSSLFEVPVRGNAPLFPAAISYTIHGSQEGVSELICFVDDMDFVPHLLPFLGLQNVSATLRFAEKPVYAPDRRTAARACHDVVMQLADLPSYAHASTATASANCRDEMVLQTAN